jgi:hypothetical protein
MALLPFLCYVLCVERVSECTPLTGFLALKHNNSMIEVRFYGQGVAQSILRSNARLNQRRLLMDRSFVSKANCILIALRVCIP